MIKRTSLFIFLLLWCSIVFPPEAFSQEVSPEKVQRGLVAISQKVKPAFVSVGGGSGIIISPDGYILTNHHVARGIPKWLVIRPGGVVHRADLIGYDSIGDIALLKILEGKNLPCVEMGDSDKIQPGQAIFALGNPWGLAGPKGHPTLTFGIISAIHRFQGGYGDCFQIDAPINPGNSGGPTFDLQGKLLGINGQIRPRFGRRTFSGVGLAIPVNQIKNFLPLLKKGGEVGHGILPKGLKFAEEPLENGGVIVEKESMDPAGKLKKGDILQEIAGYPPVNHNRIQGIVSTFPAGTSLLCKVLREKKIIDIHLVIERVPTYAECLAQGVPFRFPSPPAPYLGLDYGEPKNGGVEIIGVIEHSPADKAGIQAGDLVLSFNHMNAEDKWNLQSLLGGCRFGQKVTLEIKGGKDSKTYELIVGSTEDFPIKAYKSKVNPSITPSTPSTPSNPESEGKGELSPETLGLSFGEETDEGIPIEDVKKGSFAEKKGFQKGDLVVKLNGQIPEDYYDLKEKLQLANSKNKKIIFDMIREVRDKLGITKKKKFRIEFFWKEK